MPLRPVFAIDLDDVLLQTFGPLDRWLSGGPHAPGSWKDYVWLPDEVLDSYHAQENTRTAVRVPGAVEACTRLAEVARLFVVTFRHDRHAAGSGNLVSSLYPGLFEDVICTGHLGGKSGTLRRIGATALVDDSPKHVVEAEGAGVPGILFGDLPWNRNVSHGRRAADWNGAEELLAALVPAEPASVPGPRAMA